VSKRRTGILGENLAAAHLERSGWQVEVRNYRHGRKEIDMVVRRDDMVAFVEVKCRRSGTCGHPLEAITSRKRKEIEEVAAAWIAAFGRPDDSYRFDAVAVRLDRERPEIHHVEDAWRIG